MSIKRIIAVLTALSVLVFSFNAFAFSDGISELFDSGAKATVGTTDYSAYELKGNYTLDGTATDALCKWYISDSIFGEYTEIENENDITLRYDSYESGKYVKFVVVPLDENGNEVEMEIVLTFEVENKNFVLFKSFEDDEVYAYTYDEDGNLERYNIFSTRMLVRCDADGKLYHKPVFQILYYNDTIQIVPLLHVYCYNQDTVPFQKQSG